MNFMRRFFPKRADSPARTLTVTVPASITAPKEIPMADLETTLSLLTRHGRPVVRQMSDGGWYCKVQMHVAAAGASFDVASEFNCTGPLAAADQCLDRIHTMLRSYGADVKALPHG